VSHDPKRKQFFGKLLGLWVALGFAPKLLAATKVTSTSELHVAVTASSLIRAGIRAVSRRADSL
jgi:hypothetical protein